MAEENGMNKGWAVAVIGILIIIAVLAIKFSSTGPTDEFMGITNPEGTYGEYFMAGVGIGVIVMIIGGVMATMTGKAVEEEEEFEEELEEAEEGICPTCGAVIPIDSEECPECGEELEPPEEEEFEEEEEIVEQECPICGAEVSDDDAECPECGEPLGDEGEDEVFDEL